MAKPSGTVAVVDAKPPVRVKKELPAAWKEELAREAKAAAAVETPSVGNISFRAGVMSYQGQAFPGNKMSAIVVGSAFERALYDGPFDPNKIKNPICFALSRDGVDMRPHDNSLHKQNETCKGCPMDEWGSAGEGRRGKACKETRRLAVIPADKLDTIDDIENSELAMAKVSVTSVANWSNYVHKVSAVEGMPFWFAVTEIGLTPHVKNQFEVSFKLVDTIDDPDAMSAIRKKVNAVDGFVLAPYSMASDKEEEVKPAGPKVKRKY